MTIASSEAKEFANRWFAAWNSHNVNAIIDCYHPTIEHSSPFIKRYNEAIGKGDELSIKGHAELRGYFQRALDRNPALRFEPEHIAAGLESVILTYRRHSHDTSPTGDLAAEIFFLTPEAPRRIMRSISHYV